MIAEDGDEVYLPRVEPAEVKDLAERLEVDLNKEQDGDDEYLTMSFVVGLTTIKIASGRIQ